MIHASIGHPAPTGLLAAYLRLAPALAVGLLVLLAARFSSQLAEAASIPGSVGIDYVAVMDAALRWLAGESPYLERQLQGPYPQTGATLADSGEYLYPPVALPFFAVFTFLPPIFWWALPAALSAAAFIRLRPAAWSWPPMVFLAMIGWSIPLVIQGNPTIWLAAAAFWAAIIAWPGPLILLKPTLAPFALLGIRRRSWWIALALLVVASLPFGAMWVDWYRAVTDMEGAGPLYSLGQYPLMLIPVIAWLARRREDDTTTSGTPS